MDGPNEKVTLYINDGFSPFLEENVRVSKHVQRSTFNEPFSTVGTF